MGWAGRLFWMNGRLWNANGSVLVNRSRASRGRQPPEEENFLWGCQCLARHTLVWSKLNSLVRRQMLGCVYVLGANKFSQFCRLPIDPPPLGEIMRATIGRHLVLQRGQDAQSRAAALLA